MPQPCRQLCCNNRGMIGLLQKPNWKAWILPWFFTGWHACRHKVAHLWLRAPCVWSSWMSVFVVGSAISAVGATLLSFHEWSGAHYCVCPHFLQREGKVQATWCFQVEGAARLQGEFCKYLPTIYSFACFAANLSVNNRSTAMAESSSEDEDSSSEEEAVTEKVVSSYLAFLLLVLEGCVQWG